MLDKDHFEQHNRIDRRPAIIRAIVLLHKTVNAVKVDDSIDFPQKVLLWNQQGLCYNSGHDDKIVL